MAFARLQGSKIVVLHSRRTGSTVRQQKIHEFRSLEAAREVVQSDRAWALLCDSFQLALRDTRLDRDALRSSIRQALDRIPAEKNREPSFRSS